jgi:hypothetical protein
MRKGVRIMKNKNIIAVGAVLLGLLTTITPAYARGYRLSEKDSDNGKTTWEFEGDPGIDLSQLDQSQIAQLVASWQGDISNHDKSSHWNNNSGDEDSNDQDNSSDEFDITLSGDDEVPSVDSDAKGTGNVRLHEDRKLVCVDIEVSDIDLPATDAHIHKAIKGQAGPAVLPLPIPNEEGDAYGCVKADSGLITDMMAHPELYYVNVHSTEYPDGAARGQLSDSSDEE